MKDIIETAVVITPAQPKGDFLKVNDSFYSLQDKVSADDVKSLMEKLDEECPGFINNLSSIRIGKFYTVCGDNWSLVKSLMFLLSKVAVNGKKLYSIVEAETLKQNFMCDISEVEFDEIEFKVAKEEAKKAETKAEKKARLEAESKAEAEIIEKEAADKEAADKVLEDEATGNGADKKDPENPESKEGTLEETK